MVTTDDPANQTRTLTIQGSVEKVVDINPTTLVFQGNSGEVMEKTITIIPTQKYPLNILDIKFNKGEHLTLELKTSQINGKNAYLVMVKTKEGARGNFYDKLLIKTDSKVKPLITAWVKVLLKEKPVKLPVQ